MLKIKMNYMYLKALCRKKEYKLSPVLDKIGISPSITKYWKNGSEPKYSHLLALSEFFDVHLNLLIEREVI